EWPGRLVQDDRARRRLTQRLHRGGARPRVEGVVAQCSAALRVRLHEQLAGGDHVLPALAHQRRDGDGLAACGRREDIAEKVASGKAEDPLARLDGDPHRATTYEARVPGEIFGQLVLA